jgi:hypothetical protein
MDDHTLRSLFGLSAGGDSNGSPAAPWSFAQSAPARGPTPDIPPPAVAPPPRAISAKVRRAVDLMVWRVQENLRYRGKGRARAKACPAPTPHIAEYLRQQIARRLAIAAARAGAVKGELLDSDNELVRDRASTFVLGLAGMAPASTPSVSLNIEVKNFALSD